jgi:predicted ArsR family transcriptional regulator
MVEEMSPTVYNTTPLAEKDLGFDRDIFLRELVRELTGVLEDVVGLHEASGFVSIVGQRIGENFDEKYRRAFSVETLTRTQVATALVDLKRRINGDFYVIEESENRIVLGNRACPFAEKVLGRPSMCMMTSNVFGSITARNLGYAKVELQQTIADGAAECRVIVHLTPTPDNQDALGREYFKTGA